MGGAQHRQHYHHKDEGGEEYSHLVVFQQTGVFTFLSGNQPLHYENAVIDPDTEYKGGNHYVDEIELQPEDGHPSLKDNSNTTSTKMDEISKVVLKSLCIKEIMFPV